jgi:hypothetical protein
MVPGKVSNEKPSVLHIPDSNPTEKQLASLLKATDSTAVGVDESIGGRTFMTVMETRYQCEERREPEANDGKRKKGCNNPSDSGHDAT